MEALRIKVPRGMVELPVADDLIHFIVNSNVAAEHVLCHIEIAASSAELIGTVRLVVTHLILFEQRRINLRTRLTLSPRACGKGDTKGSSHSKLQLRVKRLGVKSGVNRLRLLAPHS